MRLNSSHLCRKLKMRALPYLINPTTLELDLLFCCRMTTQVWKTAKMVTGC